MSKKIPVSRQFNKWHDAQRVDKLDLETEQNRNIYTDASIISNHFGSGIIPNSLRQKVIFDSDDLTLEQAALLQSNDFDGTGIQPHAQPTDNVLGEQLEVELSGSDVFGRLSVKVLIIGLDFQGIPQMDRLVFYKNEKQVTKKHYSRILSLFFNDFKGNNKCSRNLGGKITIKESESFQLSRDPIMVAQDFEPDLFFRDFKVSGVISGSSTTSLFLTLQDGIGPEYSVDSLNIQTTVKQNRYLNSNDVVTKIGQKFLATTNNIQKVTLLLGVDKDTNATVEDQFDWSGNLVVSIYELQNTVSCPTDIVPELAIEFDPKPEPLAQLSVNQNDLREQGYILTNVLQPVDFIFSDTKLGSTVNSVIEPGKFYSVVINRAGAANTGEIFTGVGNSRIDNSRLTIFSGSWVDVPEEDLWFRVYHAAAKISNGQAYDGGNGIEIEKTILNEVGSTIDYSFDAQPFSDTGEGTTNTAIIQAIINESQEEQDERTGNPVFSRQKFVPSFSFVTSDALDDLKKVTDPLIIGAARDINPKQNPILTKIQDLPGLVNGNVFTVINPDPDLLSLRLVGSKLLPNTDSNNDYRIFKTLLCTDNYGDVNGDGEIDQLDIARASQLVGESLFFESTQQKIIDGDIQTLELLRADVNGDGYITSDDVTIITNYVSRSINSFPAGSTFQHLDIYVQQSIGRFDGYHDCTDGYIRLDGSVGANEVNSEDLSEVEKQYYGFVETPTIDQDDSAFTQIPFEPVEYEIRPIPFWQEYLLSFSSSARIVPAAFSFDETIVSYCNENNDLCIDRTSIQPESEPGRNDIMFPNNIIIKNGQILNPDGTNYKVDLEIANIILQLPAEPLENVVIDVFRKLVADSGDGKTQAGLNPLKFSDCTNVKTDALAKGQVKFGVAIQAFNPNLDGYTDEDGYGIIIDDVIGIYMDQENGLLTLNMKDLEVDPILVNLVTKIQITVYLKKAGWVNQTVTIPPEQIIGLLS